MTDNKMIKESLKLHMTEDDSTCDKCSYRACGCSYTLCRETLELINQLETENQKLQSENLMLSQKRITLPEAIKLVDNARNTAIKEFFKLLIHEIVNRPSEKAPDGVFYMNGRVDRQNEIIDIINELAGVYIETQKETETSE